MSENTTLGIAYIDIYVYNICCLVGNRTFKQTSGMLPAVKPQNNFVRAPPPNLRSLRSQRAFDCRSSKAPFIDALMISVVVNIWFHTQTAHCSASYNCMLPASSAVIVSGINRDRAIKERVLQFEIRIRLV